MASEGDEVEGYGEGTPARKNFHFCCRVEKMVPVFLSLLKFHEVPRCNSLFVPFAGFCLSF